MEWDRSHSEWVIADRATLTLGGVTFAMGLRASYWFLLVVFLGGPCQGWAAVVGLNHDARSVLFEVWGMQGPRTTTR